MPPSLSIALGARESLIPEFTQNVASDQENEPSRDQVDQAQGQAQPLLDQTQASAQDQVVSQAQLPVLLPQGQGRPLPVLVRHGDLDSLYGDENFSLDLDNEAALREKQARSEALDRVAEFCKLDRQDTEAKKEIMGMRLPMYNEID